VVIPTFNRGDLVIRALDSVMAQSRPPEEVIVVDDGSTDGSGARIRDTFPSVRVVRQENGGVSSARNRGIGVAGGDFIAFLDSDDEWLPEKLEQQLARMASDEAAVLCHTDEIWIRRGRRVNPMKKHRKHGGRIFEKCLPLCVISPSSALVTHSLLDEVGWFDEDLKACEDYDLWLRVCARYPVSYIDEPLVVKHGGHSDQLSQRYWGMDRFRIHALDKILRTGVLDTQQAAMARATLQRKAAIYIAGARKRGKLSEAARYETSYLT